MCSDEQQMDFSRFLFPSSLIYFLLSVIEISVHRFPIIGIHGGIHESVLGSAAAQEASYISVTGIIYYRPCPYTTAELLKVLDAL